VTKISFSSVIENPATPCCYATNFRSARAAGTEQPAKHCDQNHNEGRETR
jgi:hypothetical protein